MGTKLTLKPEDYQKIDTMVGLKGDEWYAVTTQRLRGKWIRAIHVFARQPMTKEMTAYENTASKVRVRGTRTEVEGSQLLAAKELYNALIDRVYDVAVGWKIHGEVQVDPASGLVTEGRPLDRDAAIKIVPVVVKREAIRDALGEVYSESRVAEMEGTDEDEPGKGKEED